jgi:hypothetical protein
MGRVVLAFSFALLLFVGLPATWASAQDAKTATGTVTEISASSITVKVGSQDMKFTVDAKTVVEARGAGTMDRKAAAAGQAGPKLTDVIKTGQAVEVSYSGSMVASRIRAVASAGAGGGKVSEPAPSTMTATGTVSAVAADSITISGSSGAQTFTIDANTKLVGQGVGTAAAAGGGKVAFKELVGAGDRVSVSYRQMGATMHATEVRITAKAKK